MIIGPPGSILPGRSGFDDLAGLPLVLPSAPNAIREQVNAALALSQKKLNVVAEVGAVHTTLALVAAGVGHTVLPHSALAHALQATRFSMSPLHPTIWNSLYLALPQSLPSPRLASGAIGLIDAIAQEQSITGDPETR